MPLKILPSSRFVISCLLFGSSFTALAQSNNTPLTQAVQALSKLSATLPVEKAYLQFDKPYYAAGDKIWFKGYVTIGVLNRPSAKSDILNVQLLNSDSKIVQSLKLQLTNGLCTGNFNLPDTITAGKYQVRAYTGYMKNFGDDYFFSKNIVLQNAIVSEVLTRASYNYASLPGGRQLKVNINYSRVDGAPFYGKEVRYILKRGKHTEVISKAITDNNGNIAINYTVTDTLPLSINTTMMLGRKPLVKDILVNPLIPELSVQLLPEGGYLVNGINSVIGFKAIGLDGLGKNVTGVLEDNSGKQVSTFKSTHLGMGSFKFMPETGKTYKAIVHTETGLSSIIDLPLARANGYSLSFDNSDTSVVKITIAGHTGTTDSVTNLSLIGQSLGIPCYATGIRFPNGKQLVVRIPAKRFPSGVAQFTLLSANGEPLNERVAFFLHRGDLLNLKINSDKTVYHSREGVVLNLTSTDINNKPISGNFSAAVINNSIVKAEEDDESSILSCLWLTANLKGYIEQPGYYFKDNSRLADIDLLMLTQGYRSLGWSKILKGDIEPTRRPEKGITIAGTLKTPAGKPVVMGKVRLLTTTGMPLKIDTLSDNNGRFVFDNLAFRDSTRFVVQANSSSGKSNIVVELDTLRAFRQLSYASNATADSVRVTYLNNSKSSYYEDLKYNTGDRSIMLSEVKITTVKPYLKHSANLNGPGNASQVIDGNIIRDRGCATLSGCLIGQLRGVIISGDGVPRAPQSNNTFIAAGKRNSPVAPQPTGGELLVMVDGVAVDSSIGSPLDIVNPADVASVELLLDPADLVIYGVQGHNGIILINTRRGDDPGPVVYRATNNLSFFPTGYHVTRQFYSPAYDIESNPQRADLRTTIFWSPNIFTDAEGKAMLHYFNADGKGTHRVIIEGVDSDGKLGRGIYTYTVE